METVAFHTILAAGSDKAFKKRLETLLSQKNIESVFCSSGEDALDLMKSGGKAFSLIIADYGLKDMKGIVLLEKVKEASPNSIRILLAPDFKDNPGEIADSIIRAVNQGNLQNYIVIPFTDESLEAAISSSIRLYDLAVEDKKLLDLVKKQSMSLYEKDCELMEASKESSSEIEQLEKEIKAIQKEISDFSYLSPADPDVISAKILETATSDGHADRKNLQSVFNDTILNLFRQFTDLSYKNGFEMPAIDGELK